MGYCISDTLAHNSSLLHTSCSTLQKQEVAAVAMEANGQKVACAPASLLPASATPVHIVDGFLLE